MSKDDPVVVDAGDYATLVTDYLDALADVEEAEARKDELREQMLAHFHDADVITLHGQPVLGHSFSPGSERVNSAWLKKNWPDIYAASLKLSAPSHRFTVKHEKGKIT